MFYYSTNKKPSLEISIIQEYKEEDLKRLFLFIDAIVSSPKLLVVFKIDNSIKEDFNQLIQKISWQPLYTYNIKEIIANE
jgi:hypothetical protein